VDNSDTSHSAMAGITNKEQVSVSNSELKEIMLRMESALTKRMDDIQNEISDTKKIVEENEKDIVDLKASVESC